MFSFFFKIRADFGKGIQGSTISSFVHGILQSFPLGHVGDLPMPLVVLLSGDVEEQWWLTRQERKDKPPGVMP